MPRRGVRYYRSVPPPEGEWEQDYATIARAGLQFVALPATLDPSSSGGGKADLSPIVRQLELARKHGLRVALALGVTEEGEASAAEAVAFVRALAIAVAPFAPLEAVDLSAFAGLQGRPIDLRACAEALRAASPTHLILGPGQTLPGETTDLACPADGLLPHEVADRTLAFAQGRRLWIVGLPAHSVRQVRQQAWSSLMAGAHALVYDAWRPDLHPGAEAPPALARPDGAPSARLRELERLDHLWASHKALATMNPTPAEVAVVVIQECERFRTAAARGSGAYWDALNGAYKALASRGAHVEFAPAEALAKYPVAYLAMAVSLSAATAEALRRYVAAGGQLVAEAGLARFDEWGATARQTPLHGLSEVFGARAADIPETVSGDPKPTLAGRRGQYPCFGCREPLEATTGQVKSRFDDGAPAVVENTWGAGATRLIGTLPALGYATTGEKGFAQVILDSLAFARVRPRILNTSPDVAPRLLKGEDGMHFLCALNTGRAAQEAKLRVNPAVGRFRRAVNLVSGKHQRLLNNALRVRLDPGDGLLLRLEAGHRLPRLPRWRPGRRASQG